MFPKVRTKVIENIPAYKIPIYRKATMHIYREITLLKEQQINWTKEIENMDTKIKDLMNSLD